MLETISLATVHWKQMIS